MHFLDFSSWHTFFLHFSTRFSPGNFHFTACSLSFSVLAGVGSFPDVVAPAAAHTRNNNNRRRPESENVGKSENISAALNQMQIELVGAGALLEIFNFPRARSLARFRRFSHCVCRKNKLELIFCPHGFFAAHCWEERKEQGFSEVVCVYAFNYFPAAEVLFPIITRAFFDVEINTHTRTLTLSHLLVGTINTLT